MTHEESEAAIEMLFNTIEKLIAENTAQQLAIKIAYGKKKPLDRKAMTYFVESTTKDLLKNRSDTFAWLRGMFLSSVSKSHPQPDLLPLWKEAVDRLIQSVEHIDPSEEN